MALPVPTIVGPGVGPGAGRGALGRGGTAAGGSAAAPGPARRRACGPLGAVLLAVALLALQSISAAGVRAQGADAFTVRDIAVDVTADSAAAARDSAIVQGQRMAFDQLLLNLATPEDVARLAPLDDQTIDDMVLDFEVESENVSTVRYIGRLAFRFRAAPVRQYLEQGGASYAVSASRPALVLPVLTRDGNSLLWDDGNVWLAAWSETPVDGTLVSIAVPLGDLTDIAAIDGPRALDGDMTALQAMAQRYGAGDVIVAQAQTSLDPATDEARIALDVKRYTYAGIDGTLQDNLSAPGGEAAFAELYREAARHVSAFLQQQWKQENLVSSTVEQRLAVTAPLASLEEWIDLRRRLADVSTVRRTDLIELSRNAARVDLVFVGDQAQLARALARRDLVLVPAASGSIAGGAAADPAVGAGAQTSGSVTVYPDAVAPTAPVSGGGSWELRRASSAPLPAPVAPAPVAPAPVAPAPVAPAPVVPDTVPDSTTMPESVDQPIPAVE